MIFRYLVIAVFLFSSLFAQTQIAVVDLQAQGVSIHEAAALTDRLIVELFRTNRFKVLEREMLDRIIEEQKFQLSGCNSDQCLVKLGQLANVQQIVAGSISKVGQVYTISARLISVETAQVLTTGIYDNEGDISNLMVIGIANIASQLASTSGYSIVTSQKKAAATILKSMKEVPGGTFTMGDIWGDGDADELPAHNVTLDGFFMSPYEVTNAQFIEFLNARKVAYNGYFNGQILIKMSDEYSAIGFNGLFYYCGNEYSVSEESPVTLITWRGAIEYCNWLSEISGFDPCYSTLGNGGYVNCDWTANGYRLPTEAEWEYAARSGGRIDQKYSGTNSDDHLDKYAWWFFNNENDAAKPVGTKEPNALGLFDLSGNVFEWCWDIEGKYQKGSQTNPRGEMFGNFNIMRSAAWFSPKTYLRSSDRHAMLPSFPGYNIGFRIVRN